MCKRSGDIFRGQEEWSKGHAQDPEHILLLHGTGDVQAPHRSEQAYPHTYLTSNNSQLKLRESKTDEVRDRNQRFLRPFAPSIRASLFIHVFALQRTAKTNRSRPHWHINFDYRGEMCLRIPYHTFLRSVWP